MTYPWQDKPTMSVPEVCKVLGISRSLGFKLVKEGKIPAMRLGQKRLVIPTTAVIQMINKAAGQ